MRVVNRCDARVQPIGWQGALLRRRVIGARHLPLSFQAAHRRRGQQVCPRATLNVEAVKDVAGLVLFSALPFVAVQALADSQYGKELLENVNAQKPVLQKQAQQREEERRRARQQSPWFGNGRPLWLGPLSQQPPAHLSGELPGDYGFDPAGLGRHSAQLSKFVELELLHARWAMLGALGALIPEVLQLTGATTFLEDRWWNVGYVKLTSDEELAYLGIPGLRIAGGSGVAIIALCQVLLMFGPEYARSCGIAALEPLGIFLPGDKNYPGGWVFDPLNLSGDAESYEAMRVREIKNGRLAMVAWLGFAAQAAVTRQGPVQNLLDSLPGAAST
ncbi:hypothetical protein D9Q98_006543 [Chlorella vulgaris]|uniref:Chlorophyll a-b binding protein, chloroplastic n=1 Tax=Chlorella vulgaris TaxID=3077 RepID=A0A9D4YVF3_CHLVU|nr:hypothetical protein D9Q98_006543 [Chlorella vulgaris]